MRLRGNLWFLQEPQMPRPRNTPDVLWSKVDRRGKDECWPWLGWHNADGYGRFEIDGKSYYAHRAIFLLAHPGSIQLSAPASKHGYGFIRHSCDNPCCCNPAHLEVGTQQDNMDDKMARGRQHTFKSTESPRAKLTTEDVKAIRRLREKGVARKDVASIYGVSEVTIKSVTSRRHYADV